jgi:hypothetical protein
LTAAAHLLNTLAARLIVTVTVITTICIMRHRVAALGLEV